VENISAEALRNIRLAVTRLAFSALNPVALYAGRRAGKVRRSPIMTVATIAKVAAVAAAHKGQTGSGAITVANSET
jgi:hypothetical protein